MFQQSRVVSDAIAARTLRLIATPDRARLVGLAVMVSLMVAAQHDFQILKAIVESVPVFVMDDFVVCEFATDMRFHNRAMLVGVGI